MPKILDNLYFALVLLNILLFMFEILVTSLGKKGYFFTFYFFTDIIATITLFLDLGWLYSAMAASPEYTAPDAVDYYNFAVQGMHIGRGTHDGATIRIVRLFKLLRIIKIYKHINKIMEEIKEWRDRKKNALKKKREAALA